MSEQPPPPKQQFGLQRVYLKDCSLETPMGASVFGKQWKPHMNVNLNARHAQLNDDHYEVILMVTITATIDDETAFLIEVQQAGLFMLKGLEDHQRKHALSIAGPGLLFPYLREAIDSLATKAGFPAINMQPMSFEALYAQAAAQKKEAETATH